MDEDIEQRFRAVTAQIHAVSFVTEYLLRHVFLTMPRPARLKLAEGLLQAANDTTALSGVTKGDEAASEYLADVGIRSREAVDRLIGKALRITAELEDEANARAGEAR